MNGCTSAFVAEMQGSSVFLRNPPGVAQQHNVVI
jgi:hypothetical protein